MDFFTPNLFELSFAEERTRQTASRGRSAGAIEDFSVARVFCETRRRSAIILRKVAETAGYGLVPEGLDDYDQSTLRVRHMASVRSWMGVSAFDREVLTIVVKPCVEASRVREDLADIVNVAIEELLRKRFELPGFTTLFLAARTARATVNRSYYSRISQALEPQTRAQIDALFDKAEGTRQIPWDAVKAEPGQPTVARPLILRI